MRRKDAGDGGEFSVTALARPYPAEVEASVEQLVYVREDDYTVARMSADAPGPSSPPGGRSAGVQPGETLRLTGEWGEHPRHGGRLTVTAVRAGGPRPPCSAITLYLGLRPDPRHRPAARPRHRQPLRRARR